MSHWMQTYSGRVYYPADPRPEDVALEDIAHHLSMLCRFTGAGRRFYSVAEHSVHVSMLVPPEDALVALMHDAPEAYTNDINRPLKHAPGMQGYRAIEARNWRAIAVHFGLPFELPASVKKADNEMLFHERCALLGPCPKGMTWGMGADEPATLRPGMICAYSPEEAKHLFLMRFAALTA